MLLQSVTLVTNTLWLTLLFIYAVYVYTRYVTAACPSEPQLSPKHAGGHAHAQQSQIS